MARGAQLASWDSAEGSGGAALPVTGVGNISAHHVSQMKPSLENNHIYMTHWVSGAELQLHPPLPGSFQVEVNFLASTTS